MYTNIWKKYLPVIRLLLKKALTEEQLLVMDRFDFEKVNKARKPLCAFSLEMNKGKLSPFSPPAAGKDLAEVLLGDSVTNALVRQNHYAISLSNNFKLQIRNAGPVGESVSEETEVTSSES